MQQVTTQSSPPNHNKTTTVSHFLDKFDIKEEFGSSGDTSPQHTMAQRGRFLENGLVRIKQYTHKPQAQVSVALSNWE